MQAIIMQNWFEVVYRYWDGEMGDNETVMYRSTNLNKAIAERIRIANREGGVYKGLFYCGDENDGCELFIRVAGMFIEDEEVKFVESTRIEE